MAIPSEYNDKLGTIGSTNIKHPIITFKVILDRRLQESIGPITNSRTGTVLHPNMHAESADLGRTNAAQHEKQFSSYIPGLTNSNVVRNDDGTFTAYGEQALYLKREYADKPNPLLVVTNSAPYTSA